MVELRHSPGITGGFTYAGEHYTVDNGVLEVDDMDLAREMVDSERKISWADGVLDSDANPGGSDADDGYPTNDDGEPLCVGKEDGQCKRVVSEPGGTCWQHE